VQNVTNQVARQTYREIETTQDQLQRSIALNRVLVEKTQLLIDRHRRCADDGAEPANPEG
jgi:hypothetical protein